MEGRFAAWRCYWWLVLSSLPHFISDSIFWRTIMLKNYLKIAFRILKKYKGYSFINITGFAIGMACCFLILLWVRDELSYDMFHDKARQIYRIGVQFGKTEKDRGAYTPPALAEALVLEFPEIQNIVRLNTWPRNLLVRYEDKNFLETKIIKADSSIFDVFTIPFLRGNKKTALTKPNKIVITENIAAKYFGETDPLGKLLTIGSNQELYEISGVVENCPNNSHFLYDFIISDNSRNPSDWGGHSRFTYIVLQENYPASELEIKFPDFIRKYQADYIQRAYGVSIEEYYANKDIYYNFWLQPLSDIHLNASIWQDLPSNGNRMYVYIFSIIALFILLIACVNFVNLSTARATKRSLEVGLRKVVGSNRSQLILQFLGESIIFTFIALALSIVLISLILPTFNDFTQKQMELNIFSDFKIIFTFLAAALFVGIFSGIYPALYLTAFRPIAILRGKIRMGVQSGGLRSGLVIFQFAISIIILLGTMIVYQQLTFFQNQKLGFDKDQVLVIHRANALGKQWPAFRQQLLQQPNITCVSSTGTLPGRHFDPNGHRLEGAPPNEETPIYTAYVDYDFDELLDLKIYQGRFFSLDMPTDSTSAVVINKTTARKLGLNEPIGKRFRKEFGGAKEGEFVTIIGVLEDFNYHSLHHEILPMILRPLKNGKGKFTSVKIISGDLNQTIKSIEKSWNKFSEDQPFEYSFLDEDFDNLYRSEQKMGNIFGIFSGLAIIIACLGLLGLVAFITEQRIKEIGIRKVLGASVLTIVTMLSKEFTKWILIANVIAWPIAYLAMNKWLQNFAYKINIGIYTFLLGALLIFCFAFFTLGYHAIRAAIANPVNSLKYE